MVGSFYSSSWYYETNNREENVGEELFFHESDNYSFLIESTVESIGNEELQMYGKSSVGKAKHSITHVEAAVVGAFIVSLDGPMPKRQSKVETPPYQLSYDSLK